MLTKEDFAVIKALGARGVYQKDIAAQLGIHPKTASRLTRGNWMTTTLSPADLVRAFRGLSKPRCHFACDNAHRIDDQGFSPDFGDVFTGR